MQPVEAVPLEHLAQLGRVIPQLVKLVASLIPHLAPTLLLRIEIRRIRVRPRTS